MIRSILIRLLRAVTGTAYVPRDAGHRYSTAVSCHHDGTFSFYDPHSDCWTLNALIVPHHVLATLPREERERVQRMIRVVDA
jgi:hypothetical protein